MMHRIWAAMSRFLPQAVTIAVIGIALLAFLTGFPFFHHIELQTLDLRMAARGPLKPGGETVIAALDEKSLARLGRWPWPRKTLADLVDRLAEGGAKVIVFDMVFAEPDANIALSTLDTLAAEIRSKGIFQGTLNMLIDRKRAAADMDEALAESIRRAGTVTLGYFFHFQNEDTPETLAHITSEKIAAQTQSIETSRYPMVSVSDGADDRFVPRAFAPEANIGLLSAAASRSGFFNTMPDSDGSNRWAPLVIAFGESYYLPLAVAAVCAYEDQAPPSLTVEPYGVSAVRIGKRLIPTDESGRLLINYLGPPQTFPHYAISDILDGVSPPDAFRGKIVLVGATAAGIYDLRVTPFSSVFPGVEMHATIIDNILHGRFLLHSSLMRFFDICAIVFFGLALGFAVSRLRPLPGFSAALGLMVLFAAANMLAFFKLSAWLNLVYPLATMVLIYLALTVISYFREERDKKKIRGAFQYYLTASVITEMLKNPSKLKLGGEKKELTVVFSDIRGFTTISEKLPPEDLVGLLNEYLTAMTEQVFAYDGLLDKYIGDAVMAVFGAPVNQTDHARRACLTALAMIRELDRLKNTWQEEGRPVFDIGIGINSGEMIVGNMGSKMRFDYTVMGDAVNLGSRLEGLNKQYGTRILISEYTYAAIKNEFCARELDRVRVSGKAAPVTVYELLGEKKDAAGLENWLDGFATALALYRQRRWDEAIIAFEQILQFRRDDFAAGLFADRCRTLKIHPPEENWDGVFEMTGK